MPDPAQDLGAVLLDRLARAAAIALLAARQVDGDGVLRQHESGRDALDGGPERGSVRLPGREEAERRHSAAAAAGSPVGSPSAERRPPARASASLACMRSSGAG